MCKWIKIFFPHSEEIIIIAKYTLPYTGISTIYITPVHVVLVLSKDRYRYSWKKHCFGWITFLDELKLLWRRQSPPLFKPWRTPGRGTEIFEGRHKPGSCSWFHPDPTIRYFFNSSGSESYYIFFLEGSGGHRRAGKFFSWGYIKHLILKSYR